LAPVKEFRMPRLALAVALAALAAVAEAAPIPPPAPDETAFSLLRRLPETQEDDRTEGTLLKPVVCMPFSITSAMAMTSAGARGKTLTGIEKALSFPGQNSLHARFADLRREITGDGKDARAVRLHTANRLWGQKGTDFRPEFLKLVAKSYAADLEEVDWGKDDQAAANKVNAWVKKETRAGITVLFPAPHGDEWDRALFDMIRDVHEETRLVLANAGALKGEWASRFDKKKTEHGLMHQRGRFLCAETDGAKLLALPLAGDAVRLVVILPKKEGRFKECERAAAPKGNPLFDREVSEDERWKCFLEFERKMTADKLAGALAKLKMQEVEVVLPAFGVETNDSLGLGLVGKGGDVGGIAGWDDAIAMRVVHKGLIRVDEDGVEAAAASAVALNGPRKPSSVVLAPRTRLRVPGINAVSDPEEAAEKAGEFRADRPFLFALIDANNGRVLFLGRYAKPR
jgi:serpin B